MKCYNTIMKNWFISYVFIKKKAHMDYESYSLARTFL